MYFFFLTVTVEKVELKGLSHKKNDRIVEYSFEVSIKDLQGSTNEMKGTRCGAFSMLSLK